MLVLKKKKTERRALERAPSPLNLVTRGDENDLRRVALGSLRAPVGQL